MAAVPLTSQYVPPIPNDADWRFTIQIAALTASALEDWTGSQVEIAFVRKGLPAAVFTATTENGQVLAPNATYAVAVFIPKSILITLKPGDYAAEVRRIRPNGWIDAAVVFTLTIQPGLSGYDGSTVYNGGLTGGLGGGVLITRTISAAGAGFSMSALDPSQVEAAFADRAPAPACTTAPAITGTAQVGHPLAVSNGVWTGSPADYLYQWYRKATTQSASVAIAGAEGNVYLQTGDDLGAAQIEAIVTAIGVGGQGVASAAPVGPILASDGGGAMPAPSTGAPALVFTPVAGLPDTVTRDTVLGQLSVANLPQGAAVTYRIRKGYGGTGRVVVPPSGAVKRGWRAGKLSAADTFQACADYVDAGGVTQTLTAAWSAPTSPTSDSGVYGLSNARVLSNAPLAEGAAPCVTYPISLTVDNANPSYDPAYAEIDPTYGDGGLWKWDVWKNPDNSGAWRVMPRGFVRLADQASYNLRVNFRTLHGANASVIFSASVVAATPEVLAVQTGQTLLAHWDNSDASRMVLNGSALVSQTTVDGSQTFTATGAGISYVAAAQNGRGCIEYVAGGGQMVAASGALATYLDGGAGNVTKPYSLVLVIEPTGTADIGLYQWGGVINAYATPGAKVHCNYSDFGGAPGQGIVGVVVLTVQPDADIPSTVHMASYLQSGLMETKDAGAGGGGSPSHFSRPWAGVREFEGFVFAGVVDARIVEQIGATMAAKWGAPAQSYVPRLEPAAWRTGVWSKTAAKSFDYLDSSDFSRTISRLAEAQCVFQGPTPVCSGQGGGAELSVYPDRDWALAHNMRFTPSEVGANALWLLRDVLTDEDKPKTGNTPAGSSVTHSVFPGTAYGYASSVINTRGKFTVNAATGFYEEAAYQFGVDADAQGDWPCPVWYLPGDGYSRQPETDSDEAGFGAAGGTKRSISTIHAPWRDPNQPGYTSATPDSSITSGVPRYVTVASDGDRMRIWINDINTYDIAMSPQEKIELYRLSDITVAAYGSFTTGPDEGNPLATGASAARIQFHRVYEPFGIVNAPPEPVQGQPYSYTPTVAGGTAPYSFALNPSNPPAGLAFSQVTGAITGTPQ